LAEALAPLAAALGALTAWFRASGERGIVIGGVAASVLGRPRATRDVDGLIVLDEEDWPDFVTDAARFDIAPRIADPLAFAREARVLLMRHTPTAVDLDVSLGALPFELDAVANAREHAAAGVSFLLPRAEDLMVMKAVANRPRDRVDIESLLDAHGSLDLRRVRDVVRGFAEALDAPELLADLESILTAKGR
jgi:hypothetical protein